MRQSEQSSNYFPLKDERTVPNNKIIKLFVQWKTLWKEMYMMYCR